MNQELLMQASFLQKYSEEIEQNLSLIDSQIKDLEDFMKSLQFFSNIKEKGILSGLGRGIYVKTNLEEKELFVEVGAGIIVKKTPEEVVKTIIEQIKRLNESRIQLTSHFEVYQAQLRSIISEIERQKKEQ